MENIRKGHIVVYQRLPGRLTYRARYMCILRWLCKFSFAFVIMTLVARLSPIIVITVSRTSHSPVFWGLRLRFEEVLVIALRF